MKKSWLAHLSAKTFSLYITLLQFCFLKVTKVRPKYFTTRRLEAFMWDSLVMHSANLNCYCSKNKMSACVSC